MKLLIRSPLDVFARQFSVGLLSVMISGSGMTPLPNQAAHAFGFDAGSTGAAANLSDCSDSGILVATAGAKQLGVCPLKHTDVSANVSGYVARVSVKQQFHNPYKEKIEAVYTFPLPENAAVDEMTMRVGNRVIKGNIKKREEARQIYDAARARGNVASLLDQERPNIFTQSVANIEPGQNIDIEIKYVNLLRYDSGAFTFSFPTVVGPRFIPGRVDEGKSGAGTVPDTDLVPDASRITPKSAGEGERAGHDISIKLNINAGVPIQSIKSKLHDVDMERTGTNIVQMKLKDKDKIPNKDFVVTWNVAADSVQSGYLTHKNGDEGFFTMMLIPPKRVTKTSVQPKEMVFLLDCSGSQRGLPIQKAKETMDYILDHMNPADSFQILSFNNGVTQFAEHPEVASASMVSRAHTFVNGLQANGGTWMAPAVEAACALPNPDHRLRILTFMTDGLVGNDFEIISMIKKHRSSARWFSFGTGNSVNRFLIDKIAAEGGGEADYVLLNSSAEEVGKKFYDRISSPVLTDIKVNFEGVEVKDVFPKDVADLWAQRPLYFTGRYKKPGVGKVVLSGFSGGKPYKQELKLDLPEKQTANDVIPAIWARAKVDRLMGEDWLGVQSGNINTELKDEIVSTALKYHIMSQYTSFVAVEEDRSTGTDKAKLVPVPVETPEGVQAESNSGRPMPARASVGLGGSAQSVGSAFSHMRQNYNGTLTSAPSAPSPTSYRQAYNAPSGMVRAGRGGGGGAGYGGVAGYGGGVAYGSGAGFGGLPPTSMGKFVHSPGDNQYMPGAQSAQRSLPPTRLQSAVAPSSVAGGHVYGDQSSDGPVSGYGNIGGNIALSSPSQVHGSLMKPMSRGSANKAPRYMQAEKSQVEESKGAASNELSLDKNAKELVRDSREATSTSSDDGARKKDRKKFEKERNDAAAKTMFKANDPNNAKIDPALLALAEKCNSDHKSSDKLVNGRLKVRIELNAPASAELISKLQKLGFHLSKRDGKIIFGKIAPKDLAALSQIAEILNIKLDENSSK